MEAVRPRCGFADSLVQSDETVTVISGEAREEISRVATHQVHLRVENHGRLGLAVRDDTLVEPLIQSALQSAQYGAESTLLAPAPSPLPNVVTAFPATAAMGPPDLINLARQLRDRLTVTGREVETWAERSSGRVEVANTHGVMAGYDVTLAGLGLRVRAAPSAGPVMLRLHTAGAAVPSEVLLADLVDEVDQRLAPPLLDQGPSDQPVRVWLEPRAVGALLTPVGQALLARHVWSDAGPLAGRIDEPVLSPELTLVDDPLAEGRPGSRPVDDEGVVCRRQVFIRRGVLRAALADLASATRYGVPASGHGRRSPGAPPWTGWSNLVLEPGKTSTAAIPGELGDGVLIRELPWPGGNCHDGRIALTTPWAYRVERGEITGRYERVMLQGNVFEWLNRVVLVGANARWIGSRCLPDVIVEGVELF